MANVTAYAYTIKPFAGISRVPFLLLSVAVVASGAAAGAYGGTIDPVRTLLALVGLMLLHVSVNALNEASDYESGIDLRTDPTPFSGGSKTLPKGNLGARTAYWFGYLTAAAGGLIGVYFLVVVGPVLIPFMVIGAVCVLAYTDYLARYGIGEIAAGLGLGALPVAGTALVQDGVMSTAALAAAIPAFFLTFNLLLLNEFPDQLADEYGGRLNLIHIFGRSRAAWIYVGTALAVPGSIISAVAMGVLPTVALVAVVPSALLARPVSWAIEHPHQNLSVDALRDNVIWVLGTNFLLALGIILALPAGSPAPVTEVSVYDSAFLAGRLLFGIVIAVMAINNFAALDRISEKIRDKGIAYPKAVVVGTSAPLLAAATAIIVGVCPGPATAYIVVFMVGSTFVVHNFWSIEDRDEQDNEAFHFFKNLVILAGALLLLASTASTWAYTLAAPGIC